ncbi:SH3 domain-containing protein [Ureibacillus chungkukjangi]|uniref:N-acetylmuramoyl-L-alanine amidase n=1 Tax=Ureibacillus chungkukjangi TaxID=1202712 RepID=A0A318U9X3_9BACL|nr:SH3 domain-containing protein [Ureibacillus chungkukjangi]PYF08839.1 N-acetylmuramoyl-L-alanine amidase [Ureibacillus chungkukjangi]
MHHKPLKYLISLILLCSLLSPYTYVTNTAFASSEESDLVVSADILYLREGPGLSYPVLTTLKKGQGLTFIEKQDDWYHVKAKDMEGWVASWLTSATKTNDTASSDDNSLESSSIISQVAHLNLRAEPSVSSPVLSQLNTGDEARVLNSEANWVQISFNGQIGWVSTDYVTIKKNETKEESDSSNKSNSATDDDNEVSSYTEKANVKIDPKLFTIAVDALNIRKKADLSSKKIGTAKKGEQYEVLGRENNWVKIQYGKKVGWVYSFYGTFHVNEKITATAAPKEAKETDETTSPYVTIIYNGTNLREEPSTSSNGVVHVNAGEKYKVLATEGEWYKVEVDKNTIAYVANWVVSVDFDIQSILDDEQEQPKTEDRKKGTLKGVTLVIDPGHGGNDKGTTGVRGTNEKDINLKTVELLKSKLRSAGAEVILTRESDEYVDLRKRVSISHQYAADAFISIHYDATDDSSISGFTTYYTNSYQRELAEYVHNGLSKKVTIRDRGVQPGNYLVTRENKQAAILIELGYLSNPSEESVVTTDFYREQATLGIYQGILNYFDAQLN